MKLHLSQPNRQPQDTGVRPTRDHVTRLIERYFDVHEAELYIGGMSVSQLANKFGTPIFVYDQDVIFRKINEVRSMLPPRFHLF
jgi:hypothetical protein